MQIECILKREGGTKVDIDQIEYHFAPLPDGAHVAEVKDKSHIKRFLSIPEAYEIYDPEGNADQPDDDAAEGEDADERADLIAQYEAKFGKKPHHKKSVEAIKAELEAE